jgi:chromosome partitioning protein
MRCIAIVNEKGGVLKTTSTVHLATALGRQGKKVLVVDLDSQTHSTRWLVAEENLHWDSSSIFTAFQDAEAGLALAITSSLEENVDVARGSRKMSGVETVLSSLTRPLAMLRYLLEPYADRYDYVLVDCPPSVGRVSSNALVAADLVIVPMDASDMSIDGFNSVLRTISALTGTSSQNERTTMPEIRALFTAWDPRTRVARDIVVLMERSEIVFYKAVIRRNARAKEAFSRRETLFKYEPSGKTVADFTQLAAEVIHG